MTQPRFDLLGIGNAIVDVIAHTDDAFLDRHDMRKGAMTLIDGAQATHLYARMPPGLESAGGSVANSCAVAAGLGVRTAFIGKVAADKLGAVFADSMRAIGVHYPAPLMREGEDAPDEAPTARCLILVTADGQRTMNTCLGISADFGRDDLDEALIADSAILYLEGYLFDPPAAQEAFLHAARLARAAGRRVAISLSDQFCVDRHRAAFRRLIAEAADIVFANEAEICALYQSNDFETAERQAATEIALAVLTRSEAGSVIRADKARYLVPAVPTKVVDTTGAGDAYAAGFLTGLTKGADLTACGDLASQAAALAIARTGARPVAADLAPLRL
ncbi:MAG TPA: adenosine kinase [Acidiphilium sp.]|nr:MAG: adenosine kinase [Acidiphilium sp. 21-60-14]OYV91283.1 MAG: adenosine kinase [Acidiphilium sp. 37-60-79]OZB40747.1 MAG: adenosine kinase [Acidiphilium sp. 34-60-192]HQT88812.1 adenosine kinase [Acidiphilium sp.]HQU23718.1 adenosine kinase [Acidiphilium sp.]